MEIERLHYYVAECDTMATKKINNICIITVSFGGSQFILPDSLAKETLQFIVDKQKEQGICD